MAVTEGENSHLSKFRADLELLIFLTSSSPQKIYISTVCSMTFFSIFGHVEIFAFNHFYSITM